jgi:hypothetical protein
MHHHGVQQFLLISAQFVGASCTKKYLVARCVSSAKARDNEMSAEVIVDPDRAASDGSARVRSAP